jgi:hypothetical protein
MPDRSRLPRFLSRLTWVDFRGAQGVHDTNAFHRLVAGIAGTAPGRDSRLSQEPFVIECPYRGLEVFEKEHARFFFGRETTTQHLVESLRSTRFLAVLGPSGSGKSSVVRAGLLPRLQAGMLPLSDHWRYFVFKPGAHPIDELSLCLARAELTDPTAYALRLSNSLKGDERALHIEVRLQLTNQPPEARCSFIVDQFEEVFTLCQERSARERFVDLLRYAATVAGGPTIVVLTMRTDFLSQAAEYRPLAEILSAHQFLISPMDEENLRQAIEEPARLVGLGWEEGLVDTILQDIGHEPGMLPLLEDALLQLWDKRTDKNVMTLSAYRASGGVRGALAQRADALYTALPPEQQHVARRILLRLTQPGEGTVDTRHRSTLQELETRAEESKTIKAVVQKLTDARLLVTEDQQVDVAHEALIRGWPRLRQWIDDNRDRLRIHRRITESAEEWGRLERDARVLFRGALLARALEWRAQFDADLNALERAFLDASVKLKKREEEEEKVHQLRAARSIWLRWTLATTLGAVVGWGVTTFVVSPTAVGMIVFAVTTSLAVGLAQWFVLKQYFNRAGWWILGTTVGGTVGWIGGLLVGEVFVAAGAALVGLVLGGLLVGLVVGVAQWFVLKPHFSGAGWWILAATAAVAVNWIMGWIMGGYIVGHFVGYIFGRFLGEAGPVGQLLGSVLAGAMVGIVFGLVLGAITGRPLIGLLERRISKMESGKN